MSDEAAIIRDLLATIGKLNTRVERLERATKAGGAGGGASALDDLTDVVIGTPTLGQVLRYDGSQFANATEDAAHISYAGGPTLSATDVEGALDELSTEKVDTTDSRLSNARTPTTHASTHELGGSDAIRLDQLALPTAAVPFNSQKATGLAAATTSGDAVRYDEFNTLGLSLGNPSSARPGARVYRSTAQSLVNNTDTAIIFDTIRNDNASMWSSGNATRLTIPTTGWYLITGSIAYAANATGTRHLWFVLNGTTEIGRDNMPTVTTASPNRMQAAQAYYLTAGDYLELWGSQSSGGALTITAAGNSSPEFAAVWIGAGTSAWGNATGRLARSAAVSAGTSGVWIAIPFDTELTDTGAIVSIGTQPTRWTCDTAGTYLFAGHLSFVNNVTGVRGARWVQYNSSGTILGTYGSVVVGMPSAGSHEFGPLPEVLTMSMGDYVTLEMFQSSGGSLALAVASSTYYATMSGTRVGYQTNPTKLGALARMSKSGAQSLATATATQITGWTQNTEDDATIADVDTANNRIVIGKAGNYSINASIDWGANATGYRDLQLFLNGSLKWLVTQQASPAVGTTELNVNDVIRLSAGDIITMTGYQSSGGALNVVGARCYISIKYDGPA